MDRLGKSLVLTEDEVAGSEISSTREIGNTENVAFLLVGRLLTPRAFWYDVLSSTLSTFLRPAGGMDVRLVGDNRFLLRFNHVVDRDRALRGCLWTFDRNLVILQSVSEDENPLEVDLNWCQFYVHVHDLHLRLMTREVTEDIGDRLGTFMDFDQTQSWGATIRIRVSLDVRVPLRRCLRIKSARQELTAAITYKRLPNFCYI
ncbi:UNVERIFIED_CONTAM: hypothetical protein Sradi_5528300 [Sesamum radiatum]|uniref:DUF4283 domain-containing protein n=1 Tax=Sesamum radiatum TaxID=300843 RepID=A0AAW2LBU1_SESRA